MTSANLFKIAAIFLLIGFQTSTADARGQEVCCADLGCYNPGGDFYNFVHRPMNSVPLCGLQSKLYLHLNTIRNPVVTQILNPYNSSTIRESNFRPNQKTKILIHGFLDRYVRPGWKQTLVEFLKDDDHNVIRLDWSQGNMAPYVQATANLRLVGAYVAKFIHHIVSQYGVNPADIHIIGHSLGAHGAGYAGATAQSLYNITIGRITGLDPAGPYFTNMPISVRLDPSDAEVVDTLVTNGDTLLAFGSPQPMGHINFYPNGGLHQPGCSKGGLLAALWQAQGRAAPQSGPSVATTSFDVLAEHILQEPLFDALDSMDSVGCSHNRAVALFHETIANSSCRMKSYQCSSFELFLGGDGECSKCDGKRCSTMGFRADLSLASKDVLKKFYITTTARSPFCSKIEVQFTLGRSRVEQEATFGRVYITMYGNFTKSEKILLTPDAISLKSGRTYTFFPETAKKIGKIESIAFFWEAKSTILNPLDWLTKKQSIQLDGNIILTDENDQVSVFQPATSKVDARQEVSATLVKSDIL